MSFKLLLTTFEKDVLQVEKYTLLYQAGAFLALMSSLNSLYILAAYNLSLSFTLYWLHTRHFIFTTTQISSRREHDQCFNFARCEKLSYYKLSEIFFVFFSNFFQLFDYSKLNNTDLLLASSSSFIAARMESSKNLICPILFSAAFRICASNQYPRGDDNNKSNVTSSVKISPRGCPTCK